MSMKDRYTKKVERAYAFLKNIAPFPPKVVITLGTGLTELTNLVERVLVVPYKKIPNFPRSTVETHAGELVFGLLGKVEVAMLSGRFHYYEGYSAKELTLPLRVLTLFKPEVYLATNSAGGLNLDFRPGDLMVIRDHINLIPDNPLRGLNHELWGPRFPDLSSAYDPELRRLIKGVSAELGMSLQEGVYVAVPGPSLETPAETRFLRMIGADAVGMSTVPEVIVANHAGLKVLAISVISNVNDPDNFKPILFEEVVAASKRASQALSQLVYRFLQRLYG